MAHPDGWNGCLFITSTSRLVITQVQKWFKKYVQLTAYNLTDDWYDPSSGADWSFSGGILRTLWGVQTPKGGLFCNEG